MDVGTEFFYDVTETLSDRDDVRKYEERFVVERTEGDSIFFSVYRDGIFEREIIGKSSYGNGHIRNDHLKKISEETIDTGFGKMTVDVLSSDRCGGSTVLYQTDRVYRWIQSQMWSGGIIFKQTYDLTFFKIR